MSEQVIMILVGAVLSVVGSVIAARLNKVADSVQGVQLEVVKLTTTVSGIKSDLDLIKANYVSKEEFAKACKDAKDLHDAHEKLNNEHIRICARSGDDHK